MNSVSSILDTLFDVCDNNDWSFVPDYTGKEMNGDTCVGVITRDKYDDSNVIIDAITEKIGGPVSSMIGEYCVKRIGHGWIVYFPHIKESDINEKMMDRITNRWHLGIGGFRT